MRLDGYYVLMDTCPDRESAGEFPRLSREESLTRLFNPFYALFGCACIHVNSHVLKWIGVKLN